MRDGKRHSLRKNLPGPPPTGFPARHGLIGRGPQQIHARSCGPGGTDAEPLELSGVGQVGRIVPRLAAEILRTGDNAGIHHIAAFAGLPLRQCPVSRTGWLCMITSGRNSGSGSANESRTHGLPPRGTTRTLETESKVRVRTWFSSSCPAGVCDSQIPPTVQHNLSDLCFNQVETIVHKALVHGSSRAAKRIEFFELID